MALFDTGAPTSLQQALGDQANQAVAQSQDAYTQNRKRTVAQMAHQGNLMGGTSTYGLTDLAKGEAGAESDIYSNLATTLGGINSEDWANQNDYQRNLQLATMIGNLQKQSGGALGGLMGALQGGTSGAMAGGQAGGPWGALAGGVVGGGLGAYGGSQ